MTLHEIYETRIESLHDYLIAEREMLSYFKSQKGTVIAWWAILNDAKVIISIEGMIKKNGREFLRFDGVDDYAFKTYVGGHLKEMQITDSMTKSTLRALWWHAEALQNGEAKKPYGIQFQKAAKRKNWRNREIINQLK